MSGRAIQRVALQPPPWPPHPLSLTAIQLQFNACLEFSVGLPRLRGGGGGGDITSPGPDWLLSGFRNDIISASACPPPFPSRPFLAGPAPPPTPSPAPHPRIPRCLGDHKFSTSLSEGMVIRYMSDMGVKGAERETWAGRSQGEVVDNQVMNKNMFHA